MTNSNIEQIRAKAIRNIADLLLHLSFIEYTLNDKFIKGIGDPKETRFLIEQNYNERNELIEDYVYLTNNPYNKEIIDKYTNIETHNEEIHNS